MSKSNSKSVRYHFTVPLSDVQIAEWVEKQHNFSTSLRIVIKDFIAKHGMTDASCMAMSFDCPGSSNDCRETTLTSETVQELLTEQADKPAVSESAVNTVTESANETVTDDMTLKTVVENEQPTAAAEVNNADTTPNEGLSKAAQAMFDEMMS